MLCGFTHTGKPQLARRFKGENITPNYDESLLKSVLNLGDFIAFRTVLELISLSDGDTNQEQINDLLTSSKILRELFL